MILVVVDAFFYVLVAVVVLSAIAAILSLRGDRYDHIGRGGLFEDSSTGRPEPPVTTQIRDEEARQMLSALNARRVARGEAPRDVEAELARLTKPAADPALEAEIRDLVHAKNARRARRGLPPLDVEAEVRKQVDDLIG
jgi:hypothetical protein